MGYEAVSQKPDIRTVTIAESDGQIAGCHACLQVLRPHVTGDGFVSRVRAMEGAGFRLAYIEVDGTVVAVAGYRNLHTLFAGNTIYVDDLVTLPDQRSKGYGRVLIEWLRELAISEGCDMLHLDSGTQRGQTHKFYFATGFHINCYHFAMLLDD